MGYWISFKTTSILNPFQSHFQIIQTTPGQIPFVLEPSDDDTWSYALFFGELVNFRSREYSAVDESPPV